MSAPTVVTALDSLPHGPEFRFVDQILEWIPGKTARGKYTLPADPEFLKGHFPGRPLMPGVLMVEAVAQLAGVVAQNDPEIRPLDDLRLTAVRSAKILGTIEPGDTLLLEVEILGRLGPLIQAQGTATCQDQTLLTTQITLSGLEAGA